VALRDSAWWVKDNGSAQGGFARWVRSNGSDEDKFARMSAGSEKDYSLILVKTQHQVSKKTDVT